MAMLDEWHQSSLASRTGTLNDVILDSSAAITAQIVLFAILQSHLVQNYFGMRAEANGKRSQ